MKLGAFYIFYKLFTYKRDTVPTFGPDVEYIW